MRAGAARQTPYTRPHPRLNALGIFHIQGTPFAELSFEEYTHVGA